MSKDCFCLNNPGYGYNRTKVSCATHWKDDEIYLKVFVSIPSDSYSFVLFWDILKGTLKGTIDGIEIDVLTPKDFKTSDIMTFIENHTDSH